MTPEQNIHADFKNLRDIEALDAGHTQGPKQ